ncbi:MULTISPECIES: GMC oxidoreductase [unclassified Microbacterium]|uniref:GMC oxidoreductase n=1 Tax=unclassified Microbacterium TaxID=2609290 RepID=UPI0030105DAA
MDERDVEHVDALVVGSGFGGSVAAYRLAEGGRSVVVMERGRPYPPGSFARTPSEFGANFWSPSDALYGLFETWSFRGLEGVVSSGLGGGSLIYANVLLRKDPEWFVHDSPLPGGGYENWPISREDLDPHYDSVEAMLGANPYPYTDTAKTVAFEQAARRAGLPTFRPPLAVSFAPEREGRPSIGLVPTPAYGSIHGSERFTCMLCGECDIGCNYGAKNTLDHTYLSAAAHAGADIRALHEVKGFHRRDGAWEVRYRVHDADAATAEDRIISATSLILAAGTFGSTYLLLKNRASLPGLSTALGTRFCGNGDLLGFLFNARESIDRTAKARSLVSSRGAVITSAVRVGDRVDSDDTDADGRGYYVQDAGYPGFLNWLMELSQLRSVISRSTRVAARMLASRLFGDGRSNVSRDLAAAIGKVSLSSSSMPVLGMGRDLPDGMMYLEEGRLQIDWTTATSMEYFDRMRHTMARIADELGAEYADNPLWWAKRVITVHPLGGAPMGRNPYEGVVDEWGRAFGVDDLWVLDGASMPGPVGPNPALTIAAFADRAIEHALEAPAPQPQRRPRTGSGGERRHAMQDAPLPGPDARKVRFTEQMKGFVALGARDPHDAYEDARILDEKFMFELTIETSDIDAFVADPSHAGTASGYVDADVLGGRVPVERGWFHLFVRPDDGADRRMVYRLWITPDSGAPFTVLGIKEVRDDPGFDLWDDTTTLYVQLLTGHVPPPDVGELGQLHPTGDEFVAGAGVLRIKPLDFARQMTTFRATGEDGAAAIGAFGSLFLGQLWDAYAGLAVKGA